MPDIGQEFSEDYDANTITMTFEKENAPRENIEVFSERVCEKRLLEFRKGEKADDEAGRSSPLSRRSASRRADRMPSMAVAAATKR